jgi:asparagine synthase (glutamine-hydrolysing)
MCGIAGMLDTSGAAVERGLLLEMAGELTHRGPDGVGLYRDGGFGMVNTRLSIVDLAGGDQPIANETGQLWVVYNGEIYNHTELRGQLQQLGHHFATRCDTEVIVHAWEQWGTDCLKRFNGAFAFALWDRRSREVFLARDRLGVRPLFLATAGRCLLFASECKSLLRHPQLTRQLDPLAMVETMTTWATSPGRSAFRGVRELAPGHFSRIGEAGLLEEQRWWEVPFVPPVAAVEVAQDQLVEQLRELLLDSVRLRLRADVPVGVYLSGGLDSCAIAAAAREVSGTKMRAFSLRFEDPLFDEGHYQAQMGEVLGTQMSSVEIGSHQIAELFPEVVWCAEAMTLRSSPAPMFALSRHVRERGFKVVLTGEGADEAFAGYDIFREDKIRRFWARQPSSSCRPALLRRIYPFLARDLGKTGAFAQGFFGRGLSETNHPLYSHRIRFENTRRLTALASPAVLAAAGGFDPQQELIDRLPPNWFEVHPQSRAQYLETITFMEGYLLHTQGDRMLMGNAVEGRFPFLDYRLWEFAARVPARLNLRGLREKHLLREAVAPWLPKALANRKKQPYRAPILQAFFGPKAPGYVAELLSLDRLRQAELFDVDRVTRLVTKCQGGLAQGVSETDEMGLMAVVSGMLLYSSFVEAPKRALPASPSREVEGQRVVASAR